MQCFFLFYMFFVALPLVFLTQKFNSHARTQYRLEETNKKSAPRDPHTFTRFFIFLCVSLIVFFGAARHLPTKFVYIRYMCDNKNLQSVLSSSRQRLSIQRIFFRWLNKYFKKFALSFPLQLADSMQINFNREKNI